MKLKKMLDYNPQPVTRLEKIWAAMAGLFSPAPEPVKRLEYWMTKTAERIAAVEAGEVEDVASGNWVYKLYPDGYFEAWHSADHQTFVIDEASGSLYRSALTALSLPEDLIAGKTVTVRYCNINVYHHNYIVFATLAGHTATGFEFYALSGAARASNKNYVVDGYIEGRIE